MEKQKRWQFYLILAVLILTLYNILPTIFYYANPLKNPIDAQRAENVALEVTNRVNSLEDDSLAWLKAYNKLLGIHPQSIAVNKDDARLIEISFKNPKDASFFKRFLPRAGALIPFVPAQLQLYSGAEENDSSQVVVTRQIGIHMDPTENSKQFQFSSKYEADGKIAPFYQEVTYDRVAQIALALAGPSKTANQLTAIAQNPNDSQFDELTVALAKEIVEMDTFFGRGANKSIAKRYFNTFALSDKDSAETLIQKFLAKIENLKAQVNTKRDVLVQEQKKKKDEGSNLDFNQEQLLSILNNQYNTLDSASAILRKNSDEFKAGQKPLRLAEIIAALEKNKQTQQRQILDLKGRNPFIQSLVIDWANDKVNIHFFDDIQAIRLNDGKTEASAFLRDKLNQFVINDIARASQIADETITPDENSFAINLNTLTNSTGLLAFNLGYLAEKQSALITDQLQSYWTPNHVDLSRSNFPIVDYSSYKKLKPEEQRLGLVIYSPSMYSEAPLPGFRNGSIYIIARGLDSIAQKYRQLPNSEESQLFFEDVNQLSEILKQDGFIGYSGASFGMAPEFSKDYIFELNDYYSNLLQATRENFSVKGSKRFAILDFTDVEQRILARNKIDDRVQEDLLKWKEEYDAAQVDINATSKYLVPPPTKNPYWQNFKLSFVKYFRGDDRKILKWGLDLSGGKTVRIGLRDHNNRVVTDPDDLKQAVNELYTRINKMGVSERTIHIENNNIILDFPGSQGLSAAELVKASAMYFHIVNEKFTTTNPSLKEAVSQFLQNVWNEAVVTNRKDVESINEIAWQHLGGETTEGQITRPLSDYAKILWDNGLRLANPRDKAVSSSFDDTLSAVAVMRGSDFAEWEGQPNPLLFVFHNFALEGSSLNNVQVGFDPSEGNILSFGVKSSYEGSQEKRSGSPRDDFYTWTSQFAEDKIAGTPKEVYTNGHGWRMAVILNGSVITKPALRAALREGGTISGRFSQREVNQLAADLKAGSLSFTPKILSEQNVSPELGFEERRKGITASLVALALVVIAMVSYYHFAGFVASCAVLLNIFIIWGVLQNLGAALTLPSIAGIVLTIGMAVDANVLVFERIREEFKISGRIGSAIQAGYRKAFSAIVDSNITTIIAAFILIQFDSGPIKGFAITLIIGIISSMFTALFMTRYYFAGWVQNPKNKQLKMSQFFGLTNFDFLAQTKKFFIASLIVMVIGTYLFIAQRHTMLGMDFTGGYSLVVDLEEQPGNPNYRLETANALLSHGATSNDFQIRELSRPNQLRIQLGISMEEKGHPFHQLPEVYSEGQFANEYQHNPRLMWLVKSLQDNGLNIQSSQLKTLDRDWTVMSGQFSDTMRNNAIIALSIALLSILVYITFRFEFNFAIGAVVGLIFDVIITIGVLAMFHKLGFPVQIDLQVIGAIMTIIGYALNDTIIVFDRIREDMKLLRKMKFHEIVNHALNVTLARTIMTSGTTLLVLLTLVLLGGKSIFSFALVMTIGVVVGTLSSLFIASPVMIYFHNREIRKQEELLAPKKA